jgi:DNA-binding winged helix-turn-helix (wHTH) protein
VSADAIVTSGCSDGHPDVLLMRVWRTVVVGDNVLHQAVAHLRKELGDDAKSPWCIETIRVVAIA